MPEFAGDTHPGRVRTNNEDAIGWDPDRRLWLVADGMGGHASGEVASQIVRDTLLAESVDRSLEEVVLDAHNAVVAAAAANHGRAGMGATVVAVQLDDQVGHVVWVGDSRAYLWRRGSISPLTRDHSFVELLRERQALTEDELRRHPQRNVVTQTLGLGDPQPSAADVRLRRGDWLLLCSDGLNDELTDDEIAAVLRASPTPAQAVQALIDSALAHGGRDNISVVIVVWDGDGGSNDVMTRLQQVWRKLVSGKG